MIPVTLKSFTLGALLASTAAFAPAPLHSSTRAVREDSPKGKIDERLIFDSTYRRPRHIVVYTPAGYSPTKPDGYDLLVVFDAYQHLANNSISTALDTLAATGKAGPFVAVMVDDSVFGVRLGDLANQPRMVTFITNQLMPWVRKNWNVTRDPHRSILAGSSAGGLEAAHVALIHPEIFGNVLSQSGAFWRGPQGDNGAPYEWLTDQYKKSPKKDVRFLLDVGSEENMHVMGGSGPIPLEAHRRLRDVLVAKGYEVIYTEIPGAHHDPADWEPRLPFDIVALTKGWPKRG